MVDKAVMGYAIDISRIMTDSILKNDLDDSDINRLINLIDEQIAVDQEVLYYNGEYEDIDFLNGIKNMCEDDILNLSVIRDSINKGSIITREMHRCFADIRGKKYWWLMEKIKSKFILEKVKSIINNS